MAVIDERVILSCRKQTRQRETLTLSNIKLIFIFLATDCILFKNKKRNVLDLYLEEIANIILELCFVFLFLSFLLDNLVFFFLPLL